MINTFFSGNKISKERKHYICIATTICIDCVLKVDNKKLSSSLLRTMQIQNKKRKPIVFIDAEVDPNSDDSNDLDDCL